MVFTNGASKDAQNAESFSFFSQQMLVRAKSLSQMLDQYNTSEDVPSYVQALRTTPSRDVASKYDQSYIHLEATIIEMLRMLAHQSVIILRDYSDADTSDEDGMIKEKMWGRSNVFQAALEHGDMSASVKTIIGKLNPMPVINGNDTLDVALQTMLLNVCDEVGIIDECDMITGVLSFNDLYKYLLADIEKEERTPPQKAKNIFDAISEQELSESVQNTQAISRFEAIKLRYRSRETGKIQHMAQEWVEAAWTELLILFLVWLDFSLTIFEASMAGVEYSDGIQNPLNVVTGCVLLVFAFEMCVRVFGYRESMLWRWLDLADFFIVMASIIVYILVISVGSSKRIKDVITVARVLRGLRLIKIVRKLRKVWYTSSNRYRRDGFDLDLSYISPSCIAMSLPAVGAEANYRNPREEVQRFFYDKHPDRFLLFNLCSERQYDTKLFGDRVEHIKIDNHNPPYLDQVVSFLERVSSFLDESKDNVFAAHCVDGKGRTAFMVSAWLMYCRFAHDADDALQWFVHTRFRKSTPVNSIMSSASQLRYLHYVQDICAEGGYRIHKVNLSRMVVYSCPKVDKHGCSNFWFSVEENGQEIFAHPPVNMCTSDESLEFPAELAMIGDIRLTFYVRDANTKADRILFYFWLHTGFVHESKLVLHKDFIDIASIDTRCRTFGKNFRVELTFEDVSSRSKDASQPNGSKKGKWRSLKQPSSQVLTEAKRERGALQESASLGMHIKVRRAKAKSVNTRAKDCDKEDDVVARFTGLPVPNSLCCAGGAVVSHESVEMFAYSGEEIHEHKQSKKLLHNYRRGVENTSHISFLKRQARHAVSGNKRRFQEDGFDLDLTYITPRIIAMGYPSKGWEGNYRNPESEVYRFFQQRHAGHHRIINLCRYSERQYDLDTFHGSVALYPFEDHHPPPMELILPCCAHMHTYLQKDNNNVVAVHCKAGKGRTGCMISCFLIYEGLCATAKDARKFFDIQRTHDHKGLTIISQIRYVHYFEQQMRLIKRGEAFSVGESGSPAILLRRLRMHTIPHFDRDRGCDPFVVISVRSEDDHQEYELYNSKESKIMHVLPSAGFHDIHINGQEGLRVAGDVHFTYHDQDLLTSQKMFGTWMHTQFAVDTPSEFGGTSRLLTNEECAAAGVPVGCYSLTFSKPEIDQAARDRKHVKFDADFKLEITFQVLARAKGTGGKLNEAISAAPHEGIGKRPLYRERDSFEQEMAQMRVTGHDTITFENWLLCNYKGSGADQHIKRPPLRIAASIRKTPSAASVQHTAAGGADLVGANRTSSRSSTLDQVVEEKHNDATLQMPAASDRIHISSTSATAHRDAGIAPSQESDNPRAAAGPAPAHQGTDGSKLSLNLLREDGVKMLPPADLNALVLPDLQNEASKLSWVPPYSATRSVNATQKSTVSAQVLLLPELVFTNQTSRRIAAPAGLHLGKDY